MSGLYIPDFELPKEGNWKTIRIYHTGEVARPNWQGDCTFICKAIFVPDHKGPLIDVVELLDTFDDDYIFTNDQAKALLHHIIPADKESL